jgi:hypothetical protein
MRVEALLSSRSIWAWQPFIRKSFGLARASIPLVRQVAEAKKDANAIFYFRLCS